MAEDQGKEEVKVPLKGAEAASTTLERLQKKGILPIKEEPITEPELAPPAEEEYDPSKKAFNIKPEDIPAAVRNIPGSQAKETIPPEIKKELTEEARKLNARMRETKEAPPETKELPKVPPFIQTSPSKQELSRVSQKDEAWAEKVLAANRTQKLKEFPPPEEPVEIASQQVGPAAPPWIRKEQTRMVQGTQEAAVRQVATVTQKPPLPTREQVAAKQSIQQGQQIEKKKSFLDRIPFLKLLRGERTPA